MVEKSKTFCLYPFTHIEITNDGRISPCCRYDGEYQFNGKTANILSNDIFEVLESSHAKEMRSALLKGEKYSGCHRCWRDEDLGLRSQRIRYNRKLIDYFDKFNNENDYQIISLDLKLGNTCNQMCIICGPHSSSMIANEEFQQKTILEKKFKSFFQDGNLDWYRQNGSMEKLYKILESIKYIEFYGGEPWLIKQQWQLLEKLIETGLSNNITLNYATNGSLFKDEYFIEVFSHFKSVSILYSADGIEKTFEYNRYPGKWNVFEDNLKNSFKYLNGKISARIGYTVSIYSIFNILDSLEYYSSISNQNNQLLVWFNLVNDSRSTIRNLPIEIKQILISRLRLGWKDYFPVSEINSKEALIKELEMPANQKGWNEFLRYTKDKDLLRNNKILDIIPELTNYF
jgi:MoaA/NifB/PqqE/SkfB family radical SAM enzyme